MRTNRNFLFGLIMLLTLAFFAQSQSFARVPGIVKDKDLVYSGKPKFSDNTPLQRVETDSRLFIVKDKDLVYFGKPKFSDDTEYQQVETDSRLYIVKDRDLAYSGKPKFPDESNMPKLKLIIREIENNYYHAIDIWKKYILKVDDIAY